MTLCESVSGIRFNVFFFFLGFPQCILKAFNQRLITVRVGWAHKGVKRWPRKFFSKCK